MVAAWDIYAEQLLPLGYGHPLWVPEPCMEAGQVRIGDIGYLRAGGFRFMFNSMSGGDHPINRRMGTPSGFRVFEPPENMTVRRPNEIIQTQLHSGSLRSSSVAGALSFVSSGPSAEATLRYQCSESSGAILLLRRPGNFEFLDCRLHIKAYMLEHFSRWYDFANSTLGIGLQDKEILFVSGFIKTADWAEAAFHSKGTSGELSITGGFQPIAPVSAEFSVSMLRCDSPALFYRSGPTRAPMPAATSTLSSEDGHTGTTETCDQCVFLHYYKMKSRRLWPTIRAAAEPQDLPRYREDQEAVDPLTVDDGTLSEGVDSDIESCMGDYEAFDPVGCVLDYILEGSSAEVAFASDQDVVLSGVRDYSSPGNIMEALRAIAPPVVVDEHGVGMIDISCSVARLPSPFTQSTKASLPRLDPMIAAPLRSRLRLWDLVVDDDTTTKSAVEYNLDPAYTADSLHQRPRKAVTDVRPTSFGDRGPCTSPQRVARPRVNSRKRLAFSDFGRTRDAMHIAAAYRQVVQETEEQPSMPPFWFLTPRHADHLFATFFKRINSHCAVLDSTLHTPSYTISRCPTLFTLVCTVASRCEPNHSSLHLMIVKESRRLFQAAPTRVNLRSIELAGAYLLMALYDGDCTGAGRDQRLNIMIATRIVSELPLTSNERERVTAERLWLWCYILDRSNAIGFGRKSNIIENDFIRNSATWYKRSIFNTVTDIKISAHVELLRILSLFSETIRTRDSQSNMTRRKDSDIQLVVDDYLQRLDDFGVEWQRRFTDEGDLMNPDVSFDLSLMHFLMDYSRLIISSTASLQYPAHSPHHRHFASQGVEYAKQMITTMVDTLAPTCFVQTSPSMVFMYTTVAATYLAKVTSEGSTPLTGEAINLLDALVACFSSPQVALDESHVPAVHARRLAQITDQLKIHHRHRLSGHAEPSSEQKYGAFLAPTAGCLSSPA